MSYEGLKTKCNLERMEIELFFSSNNCSASFYPPGFKSTKIALDTNSLDSQGQIMYSLGSPNTQSTLLKGAADLTDFDVRRLQKNWSMITF